MMLELCKASPDDKVSLQILIFATFFLILNLYFKILDSIYAWLFGR